MRMLTDPAKVFDRKKEPQLILKTVKILKFKFGVIQTNFRSDNIRF